MDKLLNEFTGTVRRAVDDYDMIQAGDKVAVGVSGGKDSLLLLLALKHLQSFYPKPFELEAITIELGFEGMVNVGGVIGFQLAAQQVGGESSGLAHGLAGCVKDVPLAGNGLLGYHCSRHSLASI